MHKSDTELALYIQNLADLSSASNGIRPEMYTEHHVYKGLRDLDGNGVVTGLTEISRIHSKEKTEDGSEIPCEGQLYYRGINIRNLVDGFLTDHRFGFEETIYLLLFSKLPNEAELTEFREVLSSYRSLPQSFVRDMILKAPGKDMMNILSRSVLALYTYDDNPDDTSLPNVLRQCLKLIALLPLLSVYSYHSYQHYHREKSLFIHYPDQSLSTAECLLNILREDGTYTPLEARILDLALVLHAEHGGGNNSTFTTHVVTSSGTDTYSTIVAALGSLKGPRHGGANIKVVQMFDDMKLHVQPDNEKSVREYLEKLLDKQAFDRAGLIYGMGHAVYSLSDPRSDILKKCAKELSIEKHCEEEYALYETVARLAPDIIGEKRRIYKGVSANVDFYSGLIYRMLDLPSELFTPLFAISRIVGWSAHRMEEIQNAGKIIRPSYKSVKNECPYIPLVKRT